MYYASVNFLRSAAFAKAVRDGVPVVLFNPELGVPAVEGEVTVVGPWSLSRYESKDRNFLYDNHKHGWMVRCRVHEMRITQVFLERRERHNRGTRARRVTA